MKLVKIHSWASASRPMPPPSALWHPVSQSGTGAFQYRTGSSYPGTGLVPASAFLFIRVPDWLDTGQSDIDKKNKHHISTLQTEGSGKWYTLYVHKRLLLMLLVLYDMKKSYVNAGMPECRRKVSPESVFLPAVNFFSPASAFRHQGQSCTTGHGLVRHCPAMWKCSTLSVIRKSS
jgi:hypothetical protein